MCLDDVYRYKNYNEKVSQNLYSIRFHTEQPKRHKYKNISIRNKGSMNDNEAETKRLQNRRTNLLPPSYVPVAGTTGAPTLHGYTFLYLNMYVYINTNTYIYVYTCVCTYIYICSRRGDSNGYNSLCVYIPMDGCICMYICV
jgi:hypothetical protein